MIDRQLLNRIKNEALRKAAEEIFTLADDVATRRAQLDQDGRFTPQGKAAEIAASLRSELAPKLRQLQQPIVKAMQDIEARTRALSPPAPDPTNLAAALERQEIRALLRAMPLAERSKLIFDTKDFRITDAVLTAPPELSGMPQDRFETLMARQRERLHAPAMREIAKLQADVDEARMCIEVATGEAQRTSGVPLPEFAKIMGNQNQGAPWLKLDGDQVVVVRPGESTYPIATAEEVATGKFYATAEEYWSDRPEGVRPAAA